MSSRKNDLEKNIKKMPFQSSAQLRVCVGKAMDDISRGASPKWNCEEFACHGNSSPLCKRIKSRGIGSKIHEGPRGGYYFEIEADDKTRKIYIPEKNRSAMIAKFGVENKPVKLGGKKSPKKSPKKQNIFAGTTKSSPKRKQSPKNVKRNRKASPRR